MQLYLIQCDQQYFYMLFCVFSVVFVLFLQQKQTSWVPLLLDFARKYAPVILHLTEMFIRKVPITAEPSIYNKALQSAICLA